MSLALRVFLCAMAVVFVMFNMPIVRAAGLSAEKGSAKLIRAVPYARDDEVQSEMRNNDSVVKIPQGGVLAVFVSSAQNGESSMVVVRDRSDKPVASGALIPQKNNHEISAAFAVVAIPANLPPGIYELAVSRDIADRKSYRFADDTIYVMPTDFPSETIKITDKLSRVRKPNPVSVREAKELWDITGTLFVDDVFQYDGFSIPLKKYKYVSGGFADQRVYKNAKGIVVGMVVHGGVDYAARKGTAVYAAAAGRVVFARTRAVTGNTIAISHYPGIVSLYGHLDTLAVKKEQKIRQGQRIGTVGSTGFSTGVHLHWEMRVHNVRVDPRQFVSRVE